MGRSWRTHPQGSKAPQRLLAWQCRIHRRHRARQLTRGVSQRESANSLWEPTENRLAGREEAFVGGDLIRHGLEAAAERVHGAFDLRELLPWHDLEANAEKNSAGLRKMVE